MDASTKPNTTWALDDITYDGRLIAMNCGTCGVPYGQDAEFNKMRVDDHRMFYCPNGHGRYYSRRNETEEAKERLRIARLQRDTARDEAAYARRSASAAKGHLTRRMNLIRRGVCPEPGCLHTFRDLGRHYGSKHPDAEVPSDG